MNRERLKLRIRFIKETLLIAILYVAGASLSFYAIQNTSLAYYAGITTGLMAGVVIARGLKSLIGYLTGAILWQTAIILFIPDFLLNISISVSFLYIVSEGITIIIIYRALQPFAMSNSLIEHGYGLRRFSIVSLVAPIPQAIIISFILYYSKNTLNYSYIKIIQLAWLSIVTSTVSLTPFFISLFNRKNPFQYKNIRFSWELPLFLISLIVPNALDITHLIVHPIFFPIYYLVLPCILIIAFRNKEQSLAFAIFTFYIVTIFSTSIYHGIFFSADPYINTSNVFYFILLIAYISIIVSTVITERRNAIESLRKTYQNIEKEVYRQTSSIQVLNSKLLEEIDQRKIVEKELGESRQLLAESQEIGGIASWEIILDGEIFRWSDTSYKVIGCEPHELPETLSDLFRLIHPEDVPRLKELFGKISKSPSDFEDEVRHSISNKALRYASVRGRSFAEQGVVKRIVGLSLDITTKKEAERQIAENEQRYRALFESNIDAVSLIDPENKTFIDVNHAFEETYGYTKKEIEGRPYATITTDLNESYGAIENAYRNGWYRVHTRIHQRKTGEAFYAEGTFIRFISFGKPMIFGISHDITKRIIAEKNLVERELQYRLFFESDLIGMAEASRNNEWLTFNKKFCSILGYTPDEFRQKTWDESTHPDDLPVEKMLYNEIIAGKREGYSIEKRYIRKDGSTVYCNVAVKGFKDQRGDITHMVVLSEDISMRKQAEKALLESRAGLRQAQQIAHLGNITWDLTQNYLSLNPEAYSILGWGSFGNIYTIHNFIDLIRPEKRLIVENIIEDAKNGSIQTDSVEVPINFQSTETRYLLLNIGFSIRSSIEISEIVITIADITDVKRAEIALQEANALKDQLFSIIAHDLRGPIGSINQMMILLGEQINAFDTATRDEIIKSLKELSQSSYNLLENLLEWARGQKQTTYSPKYIPIKPLIDESITLLSGMSSQKNISITSDMDKDLVVFADPYMASTVFRNLLSNAIKFTPDKGIITVSGSKTDKETIVRFTDSGIGISADALDKIFDTAKPYTTLGTNNEKGTGLGLKLVKRFVDKNGGKVEVESTPDKGTTFTVTFPSRQVAP